MNPEWMAACDFIYSKSWDHSYDPTKLFGAWFSCLKPGGLCLLEHTPYHTAAGVSELDPLGLEQGELIALLSKVGSGKYKVVELLKDCP